jgi:hypothetical protein
LGGAVDEDERSHIGPAAESGMQAQTEAVRAMLVAHESTVAWEREAISEQLNSLKDKLAMLHRCLGLGPSGGEYGDYNGREGLRAFLVAAQLEHYEGILHEQLGAATVEDLLELEADDVDLLGLKKIERRRFLRALQRLDLEREALAALTAPPFTSLQPSGDSCMAEASAGGSDWLNLGELGGITSGIAQTPVRRPMSVLHRQPGWLTELSPSRRKDITLPDEDFAAWLSSLGLDAYLQAFVEAGYNDCTLLRQLEEADIERLLQALSMSLGHARRFKLGLRARKEEGGGGGLQQLRDAGHIRIVATAVRPVELPESEMEPTKDDDEQTSDELQRLKLSTLKKRALASDVDEDALDDAEDSDHPRAAIAALIVATERQRRLIPQAAVAPSADDAISEDAPAATTHHVSKIFRVPKTVSLVDFVAKAERALHVKQDESLFEMTYADGVESAVLILDESDFEDAKAVATQDLGCRLEIHIVVTREGDNAV